MDARECLLTRRSVRKYKNEPLSDELLMEVLEPALYAPSSMNIQSWHFVVARTPEAMDEVKQIMYKSMLEKSPALKARFANHPEVVQETQNFLTSLGGAPVCVLAFLLKEEQNGNEGARLSVAAAVENLLLSAWDKGLGTCWLAPAVNEELKQEFRARFAPDKGDFVAAITLGWPDHAPKLPPRKDGRYTFI